MQTLEVGLSPNPFAPARKGVLAGTWTWTSPDGLVHAHVDTQGFDFHIDASPGASGKVIAEILEALWDEGLTVMSEAECEAETLDDGSTRIYLVPVDPRDDSTVYVPRQVSASIAVDSLPKDPGTARYPLKTLVATVFTIALLLPGYQIVLLAGM
jgi:hypothetical protein